MDISNEPRRIEIEQDTLRHLDATRKWTMFFAVIGFIFLGLLLIGGIAAGAFLSVFRSGQLDTGLPQWILIPVFIVIAAIYFFPVLFLFRFSTNMRNAVQTLQKDDLHKAFKNLRAYFAYLGVLVIIGLIFYVVALIIAGSSLAFFKVT